MIELYRNPRAWRARIVQAAVWVGLAAMLSIPFAPSPPPTAADLVATGFGGVLAVGAAAGVEYFLRRYVVAIHATPSGAVFTTLTTFASKQTPHARGEIRAAGLRHDRAMIPGAPSVDNQWIALHRNEGGFAYVLDVTPPARIDQIALARALG